MLLSRTHCFTTRWPTNHFSLIVIIINYIYFFNERFVLVYIYCVRDWRKRVLSLLTSFLSALFADTVLWYWSKFAGCYSAALREILTYITFNQVTPHTHTLANSHCFICHRGHLVSLAHAPRFSQGFFVRHEGSQPATVRVSAVSLKVWRVYY